MIRRARAVWRGSGRAGNDNLSSAFSRRFRRVAAGIAASLVLGAPSAHAAPTPFPADFRSSRVVNADATINVRVGGHGPAVVLIHGSVVPNAGHWLMEEAPAATIAAVKDFLGAH